MLRAGNEAGDNRERGQQPAGVGGACERGGGGGGGRLAQLRAEHKLGDTNVGAIDPRSETIRLVSLGLGGIANVILWTQAEQYKEREDWTSYRAVLDNLIARGLRITDAANALGIAESTVASHVKAVYRKLDISTRAEAALHASRLGLLGQQQP